MFHPTGVVLFVDYTSEFRTRSALWQVDPLTRTRTFKNFFVASEGLGVHPDGRVLLAQPGGDRGSLSSWDPETGVRVFLSTRLRGPRDVVVTPSGEIFVTESTELRRAVSRVDPASGAVTVISSPRIPGPEVGSGVALGDPRGLVASGNLLLCDQAAFGTLVRVDPDTGGRAFLVTEGPSFDGPRFFDLVEVPPDLGVIDPDGDGHVDSFDNCPGDPNPDQADADANGVGDACNDFEDADRDDHADALDNCPDDPNRDQADADADGLGDPCDPFPDRADHELAQLEVDLATALDHVDALEAELEQCLAIRPFIDLDADGVEDSNDACPDTAEGAEVDGEGCSQSQFCGRHVVDSAATAIECLRADWRNDEALEILPGDCTIARDSTSAGCAAGN